MEEKLISHALVDSVSLPTFPEGTLEGKIVGRVSLLPPPPLKFKKRHFLTIFDILNAFAHNSGLG